MDQDIRLLAGVAKPASVTIGEDGHGSPCVGRTLSSSNITGRLLPVVPAGISFPVGPFDPAGPVGPYGTLSPSDSEPAGPDGPYVAGGPVGPYGSLSPSDSVGPYVAGGPVGPDGTLSPFISDPAGPYVSGGPFGPYGTLSPSDYKPAGSVGPYVAGGHVGPDGTLPPFISDPAGPDGLYVVGGPVGPYGALSLSDSGSAILVDPGGGGVFPFSDPPPGGTLLPGEEGPGSCPSAPTDDPVPVAAVPLPAVRDPMVAHSLVEGLVRDCDDVT